MLAAGDIDAKVKGKDDWSDPGLRDNFVLAANSSAAAAGVFGGVQGVADLAASAGEEAAEPQVEVVEGRRRQSRRR